MRALFGLVRVAVIAAALWVAASFVPGIGLVAVGTGERVVTLVGVAAIFVVVEELVKPVIKGLGCVFYVLTLGLIGLVVNALLLMLVGWLADRLGLPFTVAGFWPAFVGALVVGVVSFVLHVVIPNRLDGR